jgi:riboflavin synthase
MFTGIVEGTGTVKRVERRGGGLRLWVDASFDISDLNIGDSISLNGCCLTVVERDGRMFSADVSDETLKSTTISTLKEGSYVNLERALAINGRLGGHIVLGHVDGIGKVVEVKRDGETLLLKVEIPKELSRYVVKKGSIALDGISLTINETSSNILSFKIIPHTLKNTTLAKKRDGDLLNLEVDILGKYVEKLMAGGETMPSSHITEELLKEYGF